MSRYIAGLMSLVCGAALAAETCPSKEAEAKQPVYIDRYANYSPIDTFRIAKKLGVVEQVPYYGRLEDSDATPWYKALGEIAPDMVTSSDSRGSYECRYSHAARVLRSRAAELGPQHPYVRQWIQVRQVIFERCADSRNGGYGTLHLPEPMVTDDPRVKKLQADDREYETAAYGYYYRLADTDERFKKIATSKSVHRGTAMYMSALMRATDYESEPTEESIAEAVTITNSILADPSLQDAHPLAKHLLGYLSYTTRDLEHRKRLLRSVLQDLTRPAKEIAASQDNANVYHRALDDIGWFTRQRSPTWWLNDQPNGTSSQAVLDATKSALVAQSRSNQSELLQWLLIDDAIRQLFETSNWMYSAAPYEYEDVTNLKQSFAQHAPNSTLNIWMAARAAVGSMPLNEVWKQVHAGVAATQACATAPEGITLARYFRSAARRTLVGGDTNRFISELKQYPYLDRKHGRDVIEASLAYLLVSGKHREARLVRDTFIEPVFGPKSNESRYAFTWAIASLLTMTAENRERTVEALSYPSEMHSPVLNLLPISLMHDLAAQPTLSPAMRSALSRNAWARSYALDAKVSPELNALMLEQNPAIATVWKTEQPNPQHSEHQMLLNVLRTPRIGVQMDAGLGIRAAPGYDVDSPQTLDIYNHSTRNWWCALPAADLDTSYRQTLLAMLRLFAPGTTRYENSVSENQEFLDAALRGSWLYKQIDNQELQRLSAIDSAPKSLSEQVLAWASAGAQPNDGLDEALHRAVVTTRYGCQTQGGHREYSKAAYRFLQKNYPDSPWTKKTPHWFDCSHFSYPYRCPNY